MKFHHCLFKSRLFPPRTFSKSVKDTMSRPLGSFGQEQISEKRRNFGPRSRWRPLHKTFISVFGLGAVSLAWSAVVQLFISNKCTLDVSVISGKLAVHPNNFRSKNLFKNVTLQILNFISES